MKRGTYARTHETRTAIIESAETLFAEHGIEGVSMRQIGAMSGSSNTNVVVYHFGSMDALIEAIIHHRLPDIERRRSALLGTLVDDGRSAELTGLLDALYRPLFEQKNPAGAHTYARFLWALIQVNRMSVRTSIPGEEYAVSREIVTRIIDVLPEAAKERYHYRIEFMTALMGAVLQRIDLKKMNADEEESNFRDALIMIASALSAE